VSRGVDGGLWVPEPSYRPYDAVGGLIGVCPPKPHPPGRLGGQERTVRDEGEDKAPSAFDELDELDEVAADERLAAPSAGRIVCAWSCPGQRISGPTASGNSPAKIGRRRTFSGRRIARRDALYREHGRSGGRGKLSRRVAPVPCVSYTPCCGRGGRSAMAAAKRKEAPKPECLAMVLCDDVVEDKRSNNKTLFNTFNQITALKFPAIHPKLVVFLSLTNGHGEVPFDLQFVRDKDDRPLCGLKGTVKFGDPLAVADIVLTMRGLPLPDEGHYCFRLLLAGEPVRERRLFVKLLKGGSDGSSD